VIKVATDAGGTFTDLVAFEEASNTIYVGKALTTPADPSQGVIDSIGQARDAQMAPPPSLTPSPSGKACAPRSSPPRAFAT
jgi:N-methylhydantoinase A/oxoprolinase/acetone carboxylase beta subunit